jgi:hypothetical protein
MGDMRGSRPGPARPIISLTTDFGLTDSYAAEMKGVLLRECPGAAVVDVTHAVPPQDVLAGAVVLERVVRAFAAATIHVAVVDPGVGTGRRLLVAEVGDQVVLCPDNGLVTWAWRRTTGPVRARELTWRPAGAISATFHGRDVLAPAAARVAAGGVEAVAGAEVAPVLLDVWPAGAGATEGVVIHVDHYGNLTTNVPEEVVSGVRGVIVEGRDVGHVRRTYGEAGVGEVLALVGSSGLLEIAVREGSAAKVLGVGVGARVGIER